MANAHYLYNSFLENLMRGNIPNLAVADIKCALLYRNSLDELYIFDATHETWADVKDYEVTNADYIPGGVLIPNRIVERMLGQSVLDTTVVPKETVFAETGSITASHAVIYYDGGETDVEKLLISCITFTAVEESSHDEFKLTWHADGILALEPEAAV